MVVTLRARWPFLEPIGSIGPKFFEFLTPTPCGSWEVGVDGGHPWGQMPFLEPIWSIGPKVFKVLTPATLWKVGEGGGRWWSPLQPGGLSSSPSGQLDQSSLNFFEFL